MKLIPMVGTFLLLCAVGVQAHESGKQADSVAAARSSEDAFGDILNAKPAPKLDQWLAYPRAAASPRPECSRYHDEASCEATNWCVWDGTECIDGIPPSAKVQ
ncbi:MAG TPA: hypothetical protein VJ806_07380 [Luteimonas sp.]|nr:hypothetical protein [Luteimonas sp.]